jgi:hypothetical protein
MVLCPTFPDDAAAGWTATLVFTVPIVQGIVAAFAQILFGHDDIFEARQNTNRDAISFQHSL